jgi:TP901 family phage tail tape measure protein
MSDLNVAVVLKATDELSKVVDTATSNAISDFAKLQDRIKKVTETTARLGTQGFAPTTHHLGELSSGIGATTNRMGELADVFSSAASGAISAVVGRFQSAASGAQQFVSTLAAGGPAVAAMADRVHHVSSELQALGAKSIAAGAVVAASLLKPINAFADLEDATTRAKVAFLTSHGADKQFDKVSAIAIKLGNELPGTTADFMQMAAALKEIGLSTDTIVKGGLEATAHLRVLVGNLAPEQAAQLVGTFKESLGIADKDFNAFVDKVQRAKFGFGLDPQEFAASAKYFGAIASHMGVKGLQNANSMLAISGMLRQAGLDGSTAGTSMRSMFETLPGLDHHIAKSKELHAIMAKYHMQLQFYNKSGTKFLGIENLIGQLDKLKTMNIKDSSRALTMMFGKESSTALAVIVGKGAAGYRQALKVMEDQASLQSRLDLIMGTFRNLWEAFTGTADNMFATFGESIAPELKAAAVWLNNLSQAVMDFSKAHPALTRQIMLGTAALAGFLIVAGGALVVIGTLGHGLAFGLTGWALLAPRLITLGAAMSGVWAWGVRVAGLLLGFRFPLGALQTFGLAFAGLRLQFALGLVVMRSWAASVLLGGRAMFFTRAGLMGLASGFGGGLVNAIRVATIASWSFVASLLANPITWVVIAIAAAAVLIYKYWGPISGFFRGLWQGIKEGFGPVASTLGPKLAALVVFLRPVTTVLASIWTWLKKILLPVDDVGHHAEKLGVTWGRVIGRMLAIIVDLHVQMFSAGAALIGQLVKGIESAVPVLQSAMHGVAGMVRDFWPHSPAKVGPLRDLHRTHIVEQIASAVTPAPLVSAMRRVAGTVVPTLKGGLGRSPLAGGGASSGGGQVAIHYSPTVTIGSGSAQDREDFGEMLRRHRDEIASIVAEHRTTRARSSY